ncbi:YybS family protein [Lentibacillus sp. N15]|uniref:YybS family protein n=1 Tax=Lentibacillus songyuanensis TaxID=3136161 RepID=UPI0031BB0C6F
MNRSKILTEGALFTAIYAVLFVISMMVPVVGSIAIFLLPIPFVVYASRYSWKPALVMLAASLILSAILATIMSVPLTIFMALGGIMIGAAMYNNVSAYETWARGTVGFVIGMVFLFILTQFVFNVNIVEEINQMLNQSMDQAQGIMKQFGFADQAEEQLAMMEQQIDIMKNLLPAGIAIIGIIYAFISQWLSYKVINRVWSKDYRFPPFRNLTLPVSLVWIYFFALIFTFFDLDSSGTLFLAVNNVLILVGTLMILQGYSLIFLYSHHKKWSKAIPVISIIAALLIPIVVVLVRILGIIDIGFKLRDRITAEKK